MQRRGEHSWRVGVYDLGPDGQRRRRWIAFEAASEEEARRKTQAILSGASPDTTLAHYLEYTWLPHVRAVTEATTTGSYEKVVRNRILPYLGHLELAAVTRVDVQRWLDTMTPLARISHPFLRGKWSFIHRASGHSCSMARITSDRQQGPPMIWHTFPPSKPAGGKGSGRGRPAGQGAMPGTSGSTSGSIGCMNPRAVAGVATSGCDALRHMATKPVMSTWEYVPGVV
ncbi:MAG: hypothetical protein HPY83_19520 [Anaerolineae bacterium]|nr:hypothetical protein [Anaerolineae bacterium]